MKDIKIVAIATIITICIMISCAFAMPAHAEESDIAEIFAVVIDFDYENDSVDCLDEEGNVWTFYEIEDWIIGDEVVLTVWTVTDEILDLRYIGWMDIFELSHYVIKACD